jgi:hypothetical protein
MAKVLGRSLFFAFSLACAWPAHAEPLLMFLLGAAQEIISAARPAAVPVPAPAPSTVYPGTTVEPALLKRLIDESFAYLTPEQRGEVFQALNAELVKPENFAVRGPMIENFAHRALQVRAAQRELARLSYREKQVLAEEFRKEAKSLAPEDLGPLRQVLEKGLLPVPADLNQLLLTQLD